MELIECWIAELKAHRATIDHAALARSRVRAADLALVDTSKEGLLASKYEAATERSLLRTLKEFRQVEADAAPLGSSSPADPGPEPEPDDPIPPAPTAPGFGHPADTVEPETSPQARPGRLGPGRS